MDENKVYRVGDIEELLFEFDDSDIAEDFIEADEDLMLVVSGWLIKIPSLGLSLRSGVACVPDEEADMYMPDFDVTVLYEEELKADMRIYYEQDGIMVTLGNFLHGRLSMDEIMDLECYFIIANKTEEAQ